MTFFLFLKRYLRQPSVWLMLTASVVLSCLAVSFVTLQQDLTCGYVCEDPALEAISSYLSGQGFMLCESRVELEEQVRSGRLDCGVVFPGDFSEKLTSGRLNDAAQLVTSVRSTREDTFAMVAFTAIYQEYAPYLAAEVAESLGYMPEPERIRDYMEEMAFNRLTFQVLDLDDNLLTETVNMGLTTGLLAMIGYLMMGFAAVGIVKRNAGYVRMRFSRLRWLSEVVLPQTISLGILMGLAACAGTLAGAAVFSVEVSEVLLGLMGYYGFLGLAFPLLLLLPSRNGWQYGLLVLGLVLSLIFCPVYWDVSMFSPGVQWLRFFVIPCWLYYFIDVPILSAAILAVIAACLFKKQKLC